MERCQNKWCRYQTKTVPACAKINILEKDKINSRGVIPCPYGYLDSITPQGRAEIKPYASSASPRDTLFQPDRPGWLPPQGDPRPLWRVGYQWRN